MRTADRLAQPASRLHTFDGVVPELMAQFKVPGVSIAWVREARLAGARCYGVKDAASGVPVDPLTLFEAASVSKTVFAYMALKLCDEGTLGLDTPLTRFTARPFTDDPRIHRITVRHLLSHSSGIREWRTHHDPLIQTEPGCAFEYSGEGYFYLQSTITALLGREDRTQCGRYEADFEVCATDFDRFMKQRLLRPFGMRLSGYLADENWHLHMARPHDDAGQPIPKAPPRGSDVARYGAVGGLNITAMEYAKFLENVVALRWPDQYRLSPAMHREMVRPQIALAADRQIDGCNAWGLGWGIQERPTGNLLVHSGGQAGFRSLALASLERRSGFIVLTNSDSGGKLIFSPEFLHLIDKHLRPT